MKSPVQNGSLGVIHPRSEAVYERRPRNRQRRCTSSGVKSNMKIAAVLGALLMWACPASAQATYTASVSVHSSLPPLSPSDVKSIFQKASRMLQKAGQAESQGNRKCNVTFLLKGPIGSFSSPGKEIFGDVDLNELHRLSAQVTGVDFHVTVVEKIRSCRGAFGTFNGCSFPPKARSIVVVHPLRHAATTPDHILWAHEFGHLTGLGHREDQLALMKCGGVISQSVQVTRAECDCLLLGPDNDKCELPPPHWCD